jgi:hypothetical protein
MSTAGQISQCWTPSRCSAGSRGGGWGKVAHSVLRRHLLGARVQGVCSHRCPGIISDCCRESSAVYRRLKHLDKEEKKPVGLFLPSVLRATSLVCNYTTHCTGLRSMPSMYGVLRSRRWEIMGFIEVGERTLGPLRSNRLIPLFQFVGGDILKFEMRAPDIEPSMPMPTIDGSYVYLPVELR